MERRKGLNTSKRALGLTQIMLIDSCKYPGSASIGTETWQPSLLKSTARLHSGG